ncbi:MULTISPECIES: hypothetical protein [unclassified Bradyrhizobium]|uniref:hypothetical protein n=1 Tax=Bradyrhizobium sp. USDA 4541 TaxID=2817704 RepID=UPI0020A4618E|nr:hypothetical protein [Bradyrhizobium sp. USDA 4541]MCP1850225.1 hypothetical protein [Bradyrhizobium sp. USDA 4541]
MENYNAESALRTLTGGVTFSNFVTAQPNNNLDCQPIRIFYVQTGIYTAGTVMNFTASSATAAVCDATPGYSSFSVVYNANGTWTVEPFALFRGSNGHGRLVAGATATSAEVVNEAGTATISTGYVADNNFSPPILVQNLSNAAAINLLGDYQVGHHRWTEARNDVHRKTGKFSDFRALTPVTGCREERDISAPPGTYSSLNSRLLAL